MLVDSGQLGVLVLPISIGQNLTTTTIYLSIAWSYIKDTLNPDEFFDLKDPKDSN